jgi:hypothetical protein
LSFKENPQTALQQPPKTENFSALLHTNLSLSMLSEADLELQRESKEEKAAVDKLERVHRHSQKLQKQEWFLRYQTPTSTVRLKVEGCRV